MNIETDAVIIGAGPCGPFQVYGPGSPGIDARVADTLPAIGGQCAALCPDKPTVVRGRGGRGGQEEPASPPRPRARLPPRRDGQSPHGGRHPR